MLGGSASMAADLRISPPVRVSFEGVVPRVWTIFICFSPDYSSDTLYLLNASETLSGCRPAAACMHNFF